MNGIFAVYKPVGITSHDVVDRVRKITGERRVGHGGTLDPLAEGVLVIAVGRENTKKLSEYMIGEKEYIAEIELGKVSETDDRQGPIRHFVHQGKPIIPKRIDIKSIIQKFIGLFPQMPPKFSAKKINGTPAYKLARKNKPVKLEPKLVNIRSIEITKYNYPFLTIRVICGSGVYIRSLARDIGIELGTGAYMKALKRIKVGRFTEEKAVELKNIQKF